MKDLYDDIGGNILPLVNEPAGRVYSILLPTSSLAIFAAGRW